MTDHAACAPSSAATWMNCPASITKAAGRTRPSSRYAREGTAAHTIAEMIINGNMLPPGKITVEGEQFVVGLPMLRALNPYIDYVQWLQLHTSDIHIEAKVKFGGNAIVWGTADCAALINRDLHVVDLKYGRGVPVDPDCAQLKLYAIMAAETFWAGREWARVQMTVIQPRLDPKPKTHVMLRDDLVDWENLELAPAIERIQRDDETEVPGPWCRWCVRRNECEALRASRGQIAADIFDDGVDTLNT